MKGGRHAGLWELYQLQKERILDNINAITFRFSLPLNVGQIISEVGEKCFQKTQEDYIILSYDLSDGAKIEIAEDFYLSLLFSDELMKVKLSTKYDWQFEKKIKGFSIFDFIQNLLEQ